MSKNISRTFLRGKNDFTNMALPRSRGWRTVVSRTTNKVTEALMVNIKAVNPVEASPVQRQLWLRFWARLIARLPQNLKVYMVKTEGKKYLEPPVTNNKSDPTKSKDTKKPIQYVRN